MVCVDCVCVCGEKPFRASLKNENAVYHLQIPALAPEIFKFEKSVKYANEMAE